MKPFKKMIPHRNWQASLLQGSSLLYEAEPGEIITIVGPSRAGKSALIEALQEQLYTEDGRPLFISTQVNNSSRDARFSYKDFLEKLLRLFNNPFQGKTSDLNTAVISNFRHRQVRYLFIDEAQHFKYAGRDSLAATGLFDAIKVLADEARIIVIFAGAYPMLSFMSASAHFENRTYTLELPRYRTNNEDIAVFAKIIGTIAAEYDLDDDAKHLDKIAEILHKGSLGCIGSLIHIFKQAKSLAAITDSQISVSHIEKSTKSPRQLAAVTREIVEGEQFLGSGADCLPDVPDEVWRRQSRTKPFQLKPKRRRKGHRSD